MGTYTFKKGDIFSYATNTNYADFQQKSSWTASKKPSNFGYYIKTENYEVFIPKIAREVYHLEHRKLRKRNLRGRKLRGHSAHWGGYVVLTPHNSTACYISNFL